MPSAAAFGLESPADVRVKHHQYQAHNADLCEAAMRQMITPEYAMRGCSFRTIQVHDVNAGRFMQQRNLLLHKRSMRYFGKLQCGKMPMSV